MFLLHSVFDYTTLMIKNIPDKKLHRQFIDRLSFQVYLFEMKSNRIPVCGVLLNGKKGWAFLEHSKGVIAETHSILNIKTTTKVLA